MPDRGTRNTAAPGSRVRITKTKLDSSVSNSEEKRQNSARGCHLTGGVEPGQENTVRVRVYTAMVPLNPPQSKGWNVTPSPCDCLYNLAHSTDGQGNRDNHREKHITVGNTAEEWGWDDLHLHF
ncbi:hypothetical protein NQ315_000702 [Exocentrus adspersus]|uniref:Uncharacterized protein n=1 Tax=Exocentrus adspersus TaxID=1586481 RepID=A0AAV8WDG7_9CUCU|nr:hypothetical protein NQ315_000702 [Exocentrus adspersus]